MKGSIEIKVLDNKKETSSQTINHGFSPAFLLNDGCLIEYFGKGDYFSKDKDNEYYENGKYLFEIRKGSKLYDLLESSADEKDGNYLLFNIDKLKIDGKQNFEITLNSSSKKNFTKIKFDSNIVSVQKNNEKSYSTLFEYDKPLSIDLPVHFYNLLTNDYEHTEIKDLPSQFFNLIEEAKDNDAFTKDVHTQIATSKIDIGKKTLKLAKLQSTITNKEKCFIVNGTKLLSFSPENVNIFSKDDKYMLAISLPGPKGIGNAKSTKAIAIDNLTKQNIDEIWKLIGGDRSMNIQDGSKLSSLVNVKEISKEKEFTKKMTQKVTSPQNLQNEKGNSMENLNPTDEDYEASFDNYNITPDQPETYTISPEEVLQSFPPAYELSQEELDKELGNPLTEEQNKPNSEDNQTQNQEDNPDTDETIEPKEPSNEEIINPTNPENDNDSKTEDTKKEDDAKAEEKTFDFSIIAKLASLGFILLFIFTLSSGLTAPLIFALFALTTTSLTYTFESQLSKVKIKSKSKAEKAADKEKRKAKRLEKKMTKQAKKEQKQEANKTKKLNKKTNKVKKQTKKSSKQDNKQLKQNINDAQKSPQEDKTPKQEVNNEQQAQDDKKTTLDKEKSINLYQTKQSKLNKVISTMDSKINNCNDKISVCEKEHATLLEKEDIIKSNQKISQLKQEKSFLEKQKTQVETKDKEMQELLKALKESEFEQEEQDTLEQLKNVTNDINTCIENFKKGETSFSKILNNKNKQASTQNNLEQEK